MKIGIDISQIIYGTGVSVYTTNLLSNLLSIDTKNDYIFFGGSLRRQNELKQKLNDITTNKQNAKSIFFPLPPLVSDLIWNRLHVLTIENLIGNVDIFHSSDWTQPPSKSRKVTTVHDLVPVLYPQYSDKKIIGVHKRRLSWVKKEVNMIISPSETTKKDLIKLGFIEKKIKVIPEGKNQQIIKTDMQKVKSVLNKFDIDKDYFISVGITPRKNTERLIKAFQKINAAEKFKLVLVGYPYVEIKEDKDIIITGHVTNEELSALYSGSLALLYPSLYEGYGLPILDAFSCDTPVLTSDRGVLKETAGNAAIFVDPEDETSIANGILDVVHDRKKFVKLGNERLKLFDWEKSAKMTIEVYKNLLD